MSEPQGRAYQVPYRAALLAVALWSLAVLLLIGAPSLPALTQNGVVDAADLEDPPSPPLDQGSRPVRITIPTLGIDLPVVSSERDVPGNPRGYPLCDVAQYWTEFDLPGAPGTTWIYAHAQPGMFLPLFEVAERTAGSGLLGKTVSLQLRDGRLLHYRISNVKEHAIDREISIAPSRKQHRLVLQTSEGPPGTIPKLQVSGRLVDAGWAEEEAPRPRPRACSQPAEAQVAEARIDQPDPGGDPDGDSAQATAGPDDALTFVLGSGAVLLGASFLAYAIVRRKA